MSAGDGSRRARRLVRLAAMARLAPLARISLVALLMSLAGSSQAQVQVQARPDPLRDFLRGMADSTNVYFGEVSTAFDTTGVDSLLRAGGNPDLEKDRSLESPLRFSPVRGFHRAEGHSLGLKASYGRAALGRLTAQGSYGFANREGRYRFGYTRNLWSRVPEGALEDPSRLILDLAYARETLPFAPEHAQGLVSSTAALLRGRDRQSVYESRGAEARLTYQRGALRLAAGYRDAKDSAMPLATRKILLGVNRTAPEVIAARGQNYREGLAAIRTRLFAGRARVGLDGRFSHRERWRVRGAFAQRVTLRSALDAHLQFEGGLSARLGPVQDRFELGGPLAVPSLGFGDAAGDRLLLGKAELVSGIDLLRTLRLPHPSFVVLHPGIFAHGGATWSRGDGSGEWNAPVSSDWRGAAGLSLVHVPGFPTPATLVRLQVARPIGRESGVTRFSAAFSRWFDLLD
ncbi:MAG: hypothetical protein IPK72_02330 [Candidatus Eisenbacteria bacterium]|nr:hypothetical protein [Candidatus Eisenbacteria bacterium]